MTEKTASTTVTSASVITREPALPLVSNKSKVIQKRNPSRLAQKRTVYNIDSDTEDNHQPTRGSELKTHGEMDDQPEGNIENDMPDWQQQPYQLFSLSSQPRYPERPKSLQPSSMVTRSGHNRVETVGTSDHSQQQHRRQQLQPSSQASTRSKEKSHYANSYRQQPYQAHQCRQPQPKPQPKPCYRQQQRQQKQQKQKTPQEQRYDHDPHRFHLNPSMDSSCPTLLDTNEQSTTLIESSTLETVSTFHPSFGCDSTQSQGQISSNSSLARPLSDSTNETFMLSNALPNQDESSTDMANFDKEENQNMDIDSQHALETNSESELSSLEGCDSDD
ncbi:hypothetical protein FBU30_000653 [Linnemannia zychae]|nr:hypothetical protein FBU30_000653 [Linnemannia zychae]